MIFRLKKADLFHHNSRVCKYTIYNIYRIMLHIMLHKYGFEISFCVNVLTDTQYRVNFCGMSGSKHQTITIRKKFNSTRWTKDLKWTQVCEKHGQKRKSNANKSRTKTGKQVCFKRKRFNFSLESLRNSLIYDQNLISKLFKEEYAQFQTTYTATMSWV